MAFKMVPLLFLFYFVALVVIAPNIEASSIQAKTISREIPPNSNILSESSFRQEEPLCGEWLNTNTGSIYYKAFEPVGENERCVWILGVPGARSFTVNVQYLGDPTNKPPGHQELIITGIQHGATAQPTLTFHKPTETGVITVANANLVIVSFHTGILDATPGTGFVIQYEATLGGTTSVLSTHHILTPPVFEFKYPSARSTYDVNELAALVFPPLNHEYVCGTKLVRYKTVSLDPGGGNYDCLDAVYVYNYNVSSVEAMGYWQYNRRLCHSSAITTNNFDDVVLFIFQSDATRHYQGFLTDFVGC